MNPNVDNRGLDTSAGSDALNVLTVYVVLLIAIPSRLVIGPLGGAGTPAQVVGLLGAVWYVAERLRRPDPVHLGPQPVRRAILIVLAAFLASYVAAMIRPISSAETSTANLGLVSLVSWMGIIFVTSDGIRNLDQLHALLRRISALGGALATLGIIQFITGRAWTDLIQIPGLTENQAYAGIAEREGFTRPAGTAIHAIEFGVVLAIILPIAITCAMITKDRAILRRWYPTIAIAIAVPLSISRSAIIGTLLGFIILFPTWTRSARWLSLCGIVGITAFFFVAVPGFLGTITGLFTGVQDDSNVQSRTGSYSVAWDFIQQSPIVGRGFSTFLPSYWTLDNQYLGLLIETGILGFGAILGLFIAGIVAAQRSRRLNSDPRVRPIGQALTASVAAGAISTAFFDLLNFPMSAGILFLALGLCGALYRICASQQ